MENWLKENKCDPSILAEKFGLPKKTVMEAAEIVHKSVREGEEIKPLLVGWRIRNKAVEMIRAKGGSPVPVDTRAIRMRNDLNAAREEIQRLKKQIDSFVPPPPQIIEVEKIVEKMVEVPVEKIVYRDVVKTIEVPVEKIVEKIVYVTVERKPVPLWLKIITLWWIR